MVTLAVVAERRRRERRVAVVPAEVERLGGRGIDVAVEAGAGAGAAFDDDDYRKAGAVVVADRAELLAGAEMVARVAPPTVDETMELRPGSVLIGFLPPASHLEAVRGLAAGEVTTLSFDLMPRISRAQSMDALSSQASVAGYQAVVLAAALLGRMFPMMMTAAGTVPPARVLVLGAGVAGLQAIATARRLGASVTAYDVRPEAAEEVRSLGATFLELPLEGRAGQGGYAAEQSAEFVARQRELIAGAVARCDVVVTTAAVPGRRAPVIVTTAMVEGMRTGSLVVDLAAASGGNCELTTDGEEVVHAGVTVVGAGDLASETATHASTLFARNVSNLAALLVSDGNLRVDLQDDVLAACCLTHAGRVRHQPTAALLEGGQPA
jgi:NAD(P) transhydrogenase subunit alpha